MEDRPKLDAPPGAMSDDLTEGWTGTRVSETRPKIPKEGKPSAAPELEDLEKQVNAGWDRPEE